jgi:hypothetical protein
MYSKQTMVKMSYTASIGHLRPFSYYFTQWLNIKARLLIVILIDFFSYFTSSKRISSCIINNDHCWPSFCFHLAE